MSGTGAVGVGAKQQDGRDAEQQDEQHGVNQVVAQVNQSRPPGRPRQLAGPDAPAQLAQGLHAAFGPAKLLAFVGGKLNRDLGRGNHVVVIEGAPAGQLGAVAQIQIFAERILLPAAGGWIFDARAPPDAGGAIEAQQKAGSLAAILLDGKVAVQGQGLALREQREVAVQMSPPCLDKADPLGAWGRENGARAAGGNRAPAGNPRRRSR